MQERNWSWTKLNPTGLLVNSGYKHFEFSHRVLQEDLCAYYLVRDPSRLLLPEYLANDPEPVGLAIALSSNPTSVLAGNCASSRLPLLSPESIGRVAAPGYLYKGRGSITRSC